MVKKYRITPRVVILERSKPKVCREGSRVAYDKTVFIVGVTIGRPHNAKRAPKRPFFT